MKSSITNHLWQMQEDARIRRHLRAARVDVASRDRRELSSEERSRREHALLALDRFIDRGVFPRNTDFPTPTPYLRDERGNACAVASMMLATGDRAVVEHLQSVDNNMWLGDISDSHLTRWLQHHGLTQEEAARIQVPYSIEPLGARQPEPSWAQQNEVGIVLAAAFATFFLLQFLYYTLIPAKTYGRMHVIGISSLAVALAFGVVFLVENLIPPVHW